MLTIGTREVLIFLVTVIVIASLGDLSFAQTADRRQPNIIYILADDLGYNELGCYGQTKIATPHLDRLASEGMRFTQHYSGSPVCASSRCVLLTGKHTGHAFVRGNREMGGWGPDEPEGQLPLPAEQVTLAECLQEQGYRTCAIGKWGLGGPGSSGHPCYQGFDRFYGYLCQRVAHNYYPTHLWDNHDVDVLGNVFFDAHQKIAEPLERDQDYFDRFAGTVYAPDRMIEEAVSFIESNHQEPFFLYFATPVPHVAIQVPQDSLEQYNGRFEETAYLGEQSYLPHPTPRSGYAAMITRMDRDIGQLLDLIESLGIADDTLVIFSSDNGPTFNGGTDSEFFESAGPLRGLKTMVFEGGIRVPMIARWPGQIEANSQTDLVSGFQDVLPTILDITEAECPPEIDGVSMWPTLSGDAEQQIQHESMYWELGNNQAFRVGDWKLVRLGSRDGSVRTMLFNLKDDLGEQHNLAESHPEQLAEMLRLVRTARVPSDDFPTLYDDGR